MSYLLDTHTLIWAVTNPQKLSDNAKNILQNPDNEIFVSAVSFWEISLKSATQKIHLENLTADCFLNAAIETGFEILTLDAKSAISYNKLTASTTVTHLIVGHNFHRLSKLYYDHKNL